MLPRNGEVPPGSSPGATEVRPATAELWDDVQVVFGTRGDPAGCWCQWFRLRSDGWGRATTQTNRAALRAQLDDDPPPGVVAYLDGEPVGWAAAGPRASYLRLGTSTVLRGGPPDAPGVFAVTCFVVRVGYRRRGVAGALLDGAVDLAAAHGATVVEGYPVDVDAKASVSSSELYHGSLSLFVRHGFREVHRSGTARVVVRRDVSPPERTR